MHLASPVPWPRREGSPRGSGSRGVGERGLGLAPLSLNCVPFLQRRRAAWAGPLLFPGRARSLAAGAGTGRRGDPGARACDPRHSARGARTRAALCSQMNPTFGRRPPQASPGRAARSRRIRAWVPWGLALGAVPRP